MAISKKKYILFGFLAITILAASYWGFNFLKGASIFNNRNEYYIVYERIDGLDVSSPVTVNGFQIGHVTDISLSDAFSGDLLVTIETHKKYELPDSTIAEIYSMDLMGTKGIQLVFSNTEIMHEPGDTLIGSTEQSLKDQVSMQMLPIKNQAEDLMKEMQDAIEIITYIFNESTRDNLEKSFESIKTTLAYLESAAFSIDTLLQTERQKLANIITNIDQITYTLAQSSDKMTNIFNNLSSFSDTLMALDISNTINYANNTLSDLSEITEKINNGEGTLGNLLYNDTLYNHLESATLSLDKLLTDVRLNPRKYINFSVVNFGRSISVANEEDLAPRDKRYLDKQRKKNEKKFERKTEKDDQSSIFDTNNSTLIFYMIELTQNDSPLTNFESISNTEVIEYKDTSGYHYMAYMHFDKENTKVLLDLIKPDFPESKGVRCELSEYGELKVNDML
jgi:phospholipid/cholesterol/gamma-HCH transport system substrate-binding protein